MESDRAVITNCGSRKSENAMSKKYTKLSPRILQHLISWGDRLCDFPGWTKSDTNVYALLEIELKESLHRQYEEQKIKQRTKGEASDSTGMVQFCVGNEQRSPQRGTEEDLRQS